MAIINGYQTLNPKREANRHKFIELPSVIHAIGSPALLEHHSRNASIKKLNAKKGKGASGVSGQSQASRSGGSGISIKTKISSQ